MRAALIACLKDETGSEVLEYTLLVGLIVVGCIGLMSELGIKVAGRWQDLADGL